MTTTQRPISSPSDEPLELHNGDRMTQEEFHRAYERTPENFKAELIGGIVYVASPLKLTHGKNHPPLSTIFFVYEGDTPGVECGDNTTVLLGGDAEPQPDLFMRVLPEFDGQSRTSDDEYVVGPPELVAEIAVSTRAIDLHAKRNDYTRYGVKEYLVVCPREKEVRWFDLAANQELPLGPDGIIRIRQFPGMWIDVAALLDRKPTQLLATLQRGLESPEHAEFVARLAAANKK
ncbi:MAG TPA: Uma2 family endonuclease [Humisphaera sp.]|nr:Uma2 family endonuclease [Humisphaera sp.]